MSLSGCAAACEVPVRRGAPMLHGDARVKSSMSAGSWLALVALVALGCSSSLTPSADGGGDV